MVNVVPIDFLRNPTSHHAKWKKGSAVGLLTLVWLPGTLLGLLCSSWSCLGFLSNSKYKMSCCCCLSKNMGLHRPYQGQSILGISDWVCWTHTSHCFGRPVAPTPVAHTVLPAASYPFQGVCHVFRMFP